jgi:peroxiredoxin
MTLNVGDRAPEFSLPDTHGNTVTLSSLKGQRVVLYFYPRDNTPGCTKEACGFRDNYAQFQAKNTVILGVSTFKRAILTMQMIKRNINNAFHLFSRHRSLQYLTSDQFLAHFLRHSNSRPQRTQTLGAKPFFVLATRDIRQ